MEKELSACGLRHNGVRVDTGSLGLPCEEGKGAEMQKQVRWLVPGVLGR